MNLQNQWQLFIKTVYLKKNFSGKGVLLNQPGKPLATAVCVRHRLRFRPFYQNRHLKYIKNKNLPVAPVFQRYVILSDIE
jgi:hypothetical protein